MNKDKALFFDYRSYLNKEVVAQAGFTKVFKLGN